MPTKPNRAGQQQNYVPQGNGDASGEYADHSTGSNIHFTNFKKPEDVNKSFNAFNKPTEQQTNEVTSNYIDSQNREWESKQKYETYISTITCGIMKGQDLTTEFERDEFKSKLRSIFNNANEESIDILQNLIDKHPIEFIEDKYNGGTAYFVPGMRQIHIGKDDFDRGFEEQGSSLFHELGHCINDTYKTREQVQWYKENHKLTDAYSLFEDNKSVADTLQDELKEFSANKHAPKIRKDKYKYVNEKLKEHGFTAQEFEKMLDEGKEVIHNSEEWQSIRNQIIADFNSGRFSSAKDANIELKRQLQLWKQNGSRKELFAEIEKKRPIYKSACNEWYKKTGIQAVSDAWSSKSDFGFGLGHDRSYYSKKKYSNEEPKSMVADEFFANFYAAFTTNETAALETTKKYFPRTYDKMLKLVEHIKDRQKKEKEK